MTTLLPFDRTCESSTNPPGKQGGPRGGSRLRDQVGVFQAEEWGGTHQTEEARSSEACEGHLPDLPGIRSPRQHNVYPPGS